MCIDECIQRHLIDCENDINKIRSGKRDDELHDNLEQIRKDLKTRIWVQISRKMRTLGTRKTNNQVEKYYKNTFLRQFKDRETNVYDSLFVLCELYVQHFVRGIPRKDVTQELKKAFGEQMMKIFLNDVDKMVCNEIE